MKKRFKTKQELLHEFKEGVLTHLSLQYGEPATREDSTYLTTTDPHPYEGKDIIIKISTPKESRMVQEKAFALGYRWPANLPDVREDIGANDLMVDSEMKFWHCPDDDDYDTHIVLTPQQFMEGEVPLDDITEIYEKRMGAGEVKKSDAYIWEGVLTRLYIWSEKEGKETVASVTEAWKYNLMSEKDFKAKHQDTLKFKEWEVRDAGEMYLKFGCEKVYKPHLDGFCKVAMLANTHKVDLKDLYVFLYTNKEKLGLLF